MKLIKKIMFFLAIGTFFFSCSDTNPSSESEVSILPESVGINRVTGISFIDETGAKISFSDDTVLIEESENTEKNFNIYQFKYSYNENTNRLFLIPERYFNSNHFDESADKILLTKEQWKDYLLNRGLEHDWDKIEDEVFNDRFTCYEYELSEGTIKALFLIPDFTKRWTWFYYFSGIDCLVVDNLEGKYFIDERLFLNGNKDNSYSFDDVNLNEKKITYKSETSDDTIVLSYVLSSDSSTVTVKNVPSDTNSLVDVNLILSKECWYANIDFIN